MVPAVKKTIDVNRLRADLASAGVELLAAQCAADRVRLQYSSKDIVAFGERQALKRAIAAVDSLHAFFSQIAAQIKHQESANQEAQ
jgi:hypothetical protein